MSEMAKEELVNRFRGMTEEERRLILSLFTIKELGSELVSRSILLEAQVGKIKGIIDWCQEGEDGKKV